MESNLTLKGKLLVQKFDKNGTLVEDRFVDNLVVNAGKAFIASRMSGTSSAVMSHMAVGTGSTAAAGGDTALGTEVGRVALTSTTPSTNTVTYVASFGAGTGTGALEEAGIFNDGTTGTLLCRTVFPVVNKGADDTIAVTWVVTVN